MDETTLTSHMCKVADHSPKHIQSLILPFGEVNADDTADKSLSGTSATHPQPAKEFVVTADATKSLYASESAEVQGNQPKTADSEKLMDEVDKQNKAAQEEPESPYDKELEIKIVKSFKTSWSIHPEIDQPNDANITFMGYGPIDMELDDSGSDLHSMPSDDLASLTGFETPDSNDEEFNSVTKEHSANNLNATLDGDVALPNAYAGVSALSDPRGHLRRELTTIPSKVVQLEDIADSLNLTSLLILDFMNMFIILSAIMREQTSVFQAQIGRKSSKELAHGMRQVTKRLFLNPSVSITENSNVTLISMTAIKDMREQRIETTNIVDRCMKKSGVIISGKKVSDYNANSSELSHSKASAKSLAAEVKSQALESKTSSKSNDLLLQILGAMFNGIFTQAKKLGIPPPPELAHIGKPTEDKKRKRTEILKEVFVKENIVVDEMKRNLAPPQELEARRGSEFYLATTVHLVKLLGLIIRDTPEAEEVYKLIELEIESRNDVMRAKEIELLSEKAPKEQNHMYSVKDIIIEVEDYLKNITRQLGWISAEEQAELKLFSEPIQQILSRPEVAGRLQKWSIELGEYAIHYRSRVSIKGQILADFIVERPEEDSLDTPMEEEEELPQPWILFTDGCSCTDGSGV
ncbi:hypothetical protein Tco_0725189 [Tanacetum coccineum]|uniref:Uncharacterized protein n=1 Tax=Tanacetum coccineum TaxID=301880 RepID=A0ABQ4YDM0_9ASTR